MPPETPQVCWVGIRERPQLGPVIKVASAEEESGHGTESSEPVALEFRVLGGTVLQRSRNERRKPGLQATQQGEEPCDGFECPFHRALVSVRRQHVLPPGCPIPLTCNVSSPCSCFPSDPSLTIPASRSSLL